MRRFLSYVIFIPLAIVIVVLAVANRHLVTLSFDPFNPTAPALSVGVPLFVLLFAALALGVMVGGLAVWFRQGRWRRLARNERLEVEKLRREVDRRREIPSAPTIRDAA